MLDTIARGRLEDVGGALNVGVQKFLSSPGDDMRAMQCCCMYYRVFPRHYLVETLRVGDVTLDQAWSADQVHSGEIYAKSVGLVGKGSS